MSAPSFTFEEILYSKKRWSKFPTFMLELLCIYTSVDMYMFGKWKYLTFNVNASWVQQNINCQLIPRNITDICVSILFIWHPLIRSSLSEINIQHSRVYIHNENTIFVYLFWKKKYPTFNVTASRIQQNINRNLISKNITDIHVGMLCICHNFNDSSISEINIQHSMLDFHKKNTIVFCFLWQE